MYLKYKDKTNAQKDLDKIESNLGCPILLENGYRMDRWAYVKKANNDSEWFFSLPDDAYLSGVSNKIKIKYNKEWFSGSEILIDSKDKIIDTSIVNAVVVESKSV